MRAGAVTVGGLSPPLARTVNVAGRRTSEGGVDVVLGAVGGLVSGAVGGAPVAVNGPVRVVDVVVWVVDVVVWVDDVVVWVVAAVVVCVVAAGVDVDLDAAPEPDDPHPTAVESNKTHERTANLLTFAG